MRGSASGGRGRLAGFRPRSVVLSSPYPVSECRRRLAAVTTRRGSASWYLDPSTAGRAEPRFRGDAGSWLLSVTLFEGGRNGFRPWLDGRLEPAAGGGTTLTASVGMQGGKRAVWCLIAGAGGLISVSMVAGGAALLASGRLQGLAAVLGSLALVACVAGFGAAGLRSLEHKTRRLIREVNVTLGSTATFPSPDAVPANSSGA